MVLAMHSKKSCFLILLMAATLVLLLTYAFSELVSVKLRLLVNPMPKQRISTGGLLESKSIPKSISLVRFKDANWTSTYIEKDENNHGSLFLPKEKLKFYQMRLKSHRGRRSQKALKEVPDDAHKRVMQTIFSNIENKTISPKSRMMKFMSLTAATQERIYFSTLSVLGYEKRLPTVINIGAKKAGTTAMGLFLRSHPNIASSLGNEVHYFDWNYEEGIEYYRSRMQYSTKDQEVFEKTPRYFITPDAPGRIKSDISPDVKIILLVRDPVERAISDYHHEVELIASRERKSKLTNTPLKVGRGPKLKENFEKTVLLKNGEVNSETEIIHIGKYAQHLKEWMKYFPMNQILVLDGNQISKYPVQQMKVVEKFLGLDSYFTETHFQFHPKYRVYCLALPKPMCRFSSPHKIPKPQLSNELKTKLYDFYRPFNKEFAEIINQTFPWMEL
ncbi:heparan sulfate glucosamine 3-O-sulfotransferase 1-like [Ptychodera flava]|uniref:heparan sulfate glucosamine 3-O-sulfotransferase 1-like n=1 Tax=Ptychodera flava TaxID=63121 RepID=UPI00396A8A96